MTQCFSNGRKTLKNRRFPRLSICTDNHLHDDCSRNCICIRCLCLFITRYGNLCERWSCRETRPPCFYQIELRAARSPQRRAVIRDKRGTLRDVGACARRAHPAPHLAATLPMARSLQGVGLSHPGALRAFAPLRAGAWGNGTCSETAQQFLADPCHTRQPYARSRTPLTIRTEVGSRELQHHYYEQQCRLPARLVAFSPRALPTRQRLR